MLCFLITKSYSAWALDAGADSNSRPSARPLTIPQLPTTSPEITSPEERKSKSSSRIENTEKKLKIDNIEFSGNTVIETAELLELSKPYLHKPVSINDLEDLRKIITHLYIDKGFVTSGATFPPGALQGKTLHIKIIEGKLSEMRIEGNGWLRDGYIKSRLIKDKDEPLNMKELQNRFRLLLTDPLFDHLNGRLIPGQERGVSILDIDVTRARPYQLTFVSDNYRTPSIGAIAEGGYGWIRNLTSQGDFLDFSYMHSDGAQQMSGSWVVPIWDYGTKAYLISSHSSSTIIDSKLASLNIHSNTFTIEGGINQLIIDNIDRRLTLSAGIGVKENSTSLLGQSFSFIPGQPTGNNQVSFVRFNQEYIERWATQVLAVRSTFSVGINAFGASTTANPMNPSSNYFAWLGQGQYNWRLPYLTGTDVVFKNNLQLANSSLMPLERIAVGGRYTVRGYRENWLVRDNGFSGTAEVHLPILPMILNNPQPNYRLDLVPFFDYGSAWNNPDGVQSPTTHTYLYSSGLGFMLKLPHVNSELYWGQALKAANPKTTGNLQDSGIHFQVRVDAF